MNYSEKLLDHYNHPRNMGSLDKADPHVGTGIVGSPECGDATSTRTLLLPSVAFS